MAAMDAFSPAIGLRRGPQFRPFPASQISSRRSRFRLHRNAESLKRSLMPKLTKSALLQVIAQETETDRKTAAFFLDVIAEIALREVKKNGEFTLPGIGKLVKQKRKARMGRNPATGASIKIPAKTVVKFRVAKAAKDAVLGK